MRYQHRLLLALVPLLAITGCAETSSSSEPELPADLLLRGDSFVPVKRIAEAGAAADRSDVLRDFNVPDVAQPVDEEEQDYYLAIRKDALEQQWFLSAYMKQYFPGGVDAGAAASLGTKVVSFRIQNGRLYVFDVDNRKAASDVFDPEILIEAYPIVERLRYFDALKGSQEYILIDPAAGLNSFGVVGDTFAAGGLSLDYQPRRFEVQLSFVQRFRQLDDGVTYEQVFTGYSETPIELGDVIESNTFRAAGTLSIALRRYQEDPNYVPMELPPENHYFASEPRVITNTGEIGEVVARWAIHPGMEPIRWLISPKLVEANAAPEYADYDLVGAFRLGIESWNDAFGFTVFTAEVASPDVSFADDDVNYLIFDPNPSIPYAYANFRTNPNTGEIRGANVYMGASWLASADRASGPAESEPDAEDGTTTGELQDVAAGKPIPSLIWNAVHSKPLCRLHAHEITNRSISALEDGDRPLTKKEKFERSLTYVVAHEIGHTLSLRHNFKGSLEPVTSSVMDYLLGGDRILQPTPGSYDVAAVQYLYGLSDAPPTQPFCTDEQVTMDPDCEVFDATANPLDEFHIPYYGFISGLVLNPAPDTPFQRVLVRLGYATNPLFDYIRAGSREQALSAWNVLIAEINTEYLQSAGELPAEYVAGADFLMTWILEGLYISPPFTRGEVPFQPSDPVVLGAILGELYASLVDSDGFRSFELRRLIVDILKQMQTDNALAVLSSARQAVQQSLSSGELDARTQLLTGELLTRIQLALDPYYE